MSNPELDRPGLECDNPPVAPPPWSRSAHVFDVIHASGTPSSRPSVPGYELIRELGRGPTGVVYQARQLLYNRLVALEWINEATVGGAHDLTAFCAAAGRRPACSTPTSLPFSRPATRRGALPGIGVRGGRVSSGADRPVPFPARDAARLVETLARAVHYAHEHGVVHGRLSPAHDAILPAGGEPRIAGFGLADLPARRAGRASFPRRSRLCLPGAGPVAGRSGERPAGAARGGPAASRTCRAAKAWDTPGPPLRGRSPPGRRLADRPGTGRGRHRSGSDP